MANKIPKAGDVGYIKATGNWGAVRVGEVFQGTWKQASRPEQLTLHVNGLPGATAHPIIFMNKDNGTAIIKNFVVVEPPKNLHESLDAKTSSEYHEMYKKVQTGVISDEVWTAYCQKLLSKIMTQHADVFHRLKVSGPR
jgi:hypothetical protein